MYLVKDKNTISALGVGEYDITPDAAYIIPDVLYPAWHSLLTDNTGQTFTDSSATGHAITAGGAHHSSVNQKVGTTSIAFDGDDDYIRAPDSADWDFGNGDFTIEWWQNMSPGDSSTGIWAHWESGQDRFQCYKNTANRVTVYSMYNSGTGYPAASGTELTSPTAVVFGAWEHYAVVCVGDGSSGGTHKLYRNGVLEATEDHAVSQTGVAGYFNIGHESQAAHEWYEGYIDEFRVVKGTAVYTGAFTPPTALTQTGGTYVSGTNVNTSITSGHTKLLIHSAETTGVHIGAYGTEQADGFKYYYTDIKGSKPIKDPRIGAHYGSQRHKFKSLQPLEQETYMNGYNVSSIDGREWIRVWTATVSTQIVSHNGSRGQGLRGDTASMSWSFEVVGYFSAANIICYVSNLTHIDDCDIFIDGTSVSTGQNYGTAALNTPLEGRSVDNDAVVALNLGGTTLGLHTMRFRSQNTGNNSGDFSGIELIAQDTTSSATKVQIQIPSQNVVSFGKKFTVAASTPHYNPFAYAGDGTTAVAIGNTTSHGKVATGWTGATSAYFDSSLDTATSLGLAAWEHGGDFYRPIMGGRIVKWVDSSGNIKTSVNMMPPAGTACGNATGTNTPVAENWTTRYQPVEAHSTTIDQSQAEVAKTFHIREFGNGNGNGGTGGNWKDASMATTSQANLAFVMDDGLTSFSGYQAVAQGSSLMPNNGGAETMFTFIGTGVTIHNNNSGGGGLYTSSSGGSTHHIFQNLPYGTHILTLERNDSPAGTVVRIDGIALGTLTNVMLYGSVFEISFHQPKMPPIPENAVVIADYMLMADFVQQTTGSDTLDHISKGVRYLSTSRDVFYKDGSWAFSQGTWIAVEGAATATDASITAFADNATLVAYNHPSRARQFEINGSTVSTTTHGSVHGSIQYATGGDLPTLGVNKFGTDGTGSSTMDTRWWQLASPIHTSSHYQTFETPYLHELVGGDRNMEQTNLVVTPDGKTWDEVTRDTSYIGSCALWIGTDTSFNNSTFVIMDDLRGLFSKRGDMVQKDFAHAYDRQVCLRTGQYAIHARAMSTTSSNGVEHAQIYVNGTQRKVGHGGGSGHTESHVMSCGQLKRGDYVQIKGDWYPANTEQQYWIERI